MSWQLTLWVTFDYTLVNMSGQMLEGLIPGVVDSRLLPL
jgi:hypothetical protein